MVNIAQICAFVSYPGLNPSSRGCVVIASGGERRSGSKALECGSLKLWEIGDCIKLNIFILLARLNPNG